MVQPQTRRRWWFLALVVVTLGVLLRGFLPEPIPVTVATAARGPLLVPLEEDGETRARERYLVSAPAAGRVERIELKEGDAVRSGQPVVRLWPVPLSTREHEELEARVDAQAALVREAAERVRHAEIDHQQARRELDRIEALHRSGALSEVEAERARVAESTCGNELRVARFAVSSARANLAATRAALPAGGSGVVPIASPVDGRVLQIFERSERVVTAGAPLLVLGDPTRLEVVVDLLSADAVQVEPGMPVELRGWGGETALRARVRQVEPHAFTRISALGVEEQRVNVRIDIIDPPGRLGDGYRVEARIVLWSGSDVLKIPASALFRHGAAWSLFVVERGRAQRRLVEPGHRSPDEVEILSGLGPGVSVIVHPAGDLEDGRRVRVGTPDTGR